MYKVLAFCFLSFVFINDTIKIKWEDLYDVKFEEKWLEEAQAYFQFPKFGESIEKLEDQQIEISGYVIPLDIDADLYVLSANPFAACFFCGGAGPETIMSLRLTTDHRRFKTDEYLTFTGILKLNQNDIYELNYILEDADLVE